LWAVSPARHRKKDECSAAGDTRFGVRCRDEQQVELCYFEMLGAWQLNDRTHSKGLRGRRGCGWQGRVRTAGDCAWTNYPGVVPARCNGMNPRAPDRATPPQVATASSVGLLAVGFRGVVDEQTSTARADDATFAETHAGSA